MQNDHSKIPVVHLSIEFSLMLIKYAELLETNNKHIVAYEVLKCGTSIGAYVMESQSVDNNTDYFGKLRMADREAHKTWYWLYLCEHMLENHMNKELSAMLEKIMHLLHGILAQAEKKVAI
jgi:four helix bundle protein